jgi:hypothetical protein
MIATGREGVGGLTMTTRATTYRAFLLRVWTPNRSSGARATLTDVTTGEFRVFPDLEDLYGWLQRTVGGTHSPS